MFTVKEIDLTRLETFASFFDEGWEASLVEGVASQAYQRWRELVGQRLQTSRSAYLSGLVTPRFSQQGRRAVIKLRGEFAHMLEEGAPPYDMRTALLKDGQPYRDIPFRHRSPGSNFAAPGMPMGYQFRLKLGEEQAAKLGRRVMRKARQLGKDGRGARGFASGGGIYRERLKAGLAPLLKRHHATDIFAGMAKIRTSDRKGASNRYVTWRRISATEGKGSTWMHPGIRPHHLLDQVVADLDEMANHMADGLIEGVLFYRGGA